MDSLSTFISILLDIEHNILYVYNIYKIMPRPISPPARIQTLVGLYDKLCYKLTHSILHAP